MWKKQKRILNRLHKRYGRFKVASRTTSGHWVYFDYPSRDAMSVLKTDGITDRIIMKDEIVVESDLPMRQMNHGVSRMLKLKLIKNNIGFQEWFSGNKSYHIHINFPELMMVHNRNDLKLLKKCFLSWLYDFDDEARAKHKIDNALTGNHLIRIEYGWSYLTGIRKSIRDEHEVEDNILPTGVWLKYTQEKKKKTIHSGSRESVFNKPCVMFFYRNKFSDCRKRIAFILFNQFKREFGAEKAGKVLKEWNVNNDNHIRNDDIQYIIDYHSNRSATPSCPYIKDILRELGYIKLCEGCK